MTKRPSLTDFTMSRRTAMGMALAAMFAGKLATLPGLVAADDAPDGTWNWAGNAGHTGEFPGPGLDFDKPLGELWRMAGGIFGEFVGYLNGVVYTVNGRNGAYEPTMIAGRNVLDGKLLWWIKATNTPASPAVDGTLVATGTPEADVEDVYFLSRIAIENDDVLVTLSNGHLWALDALTGELRWDFDGGSDGIQDPTVVDHVAYFGTSSGVCAVGLEDLPEVRWKTDFGGEVLGVHGGLVYVFHWGNAEIRALTIEDGSEFWRSTSDELGSLYSSMGIVGGDFLGWLTNDETGQSNLTMLEDSGAVKWSQNAYDLYAPYYCWFLKDVVATVTADSYTDTYGIRGVFPENGQLFWDLELQVDRWSYDGNRPIISAGIAYVSVYDRYEDRRMIVAADPGNAKLVGAMETGMTPFFVGDGVMLAHDNDTDEIVAIGAASAVLQVGGRAKVTENVALRGAPSESAIAREELSPDTIVEVTGESETTKETEWLPVKVTESGASGWMPASVLEGVDGGIKFSPIDINMFGQFTAQSKFSAGTKAEITEKVEIQGAPSESSAKKSTLEPGTLVTVTSPPTTTDDVEWCPIVVDDTGENGWVPTSVLALAPSAARARESVLG